MTPPKNTRELLTFIGIVNYYRDMWDRRLNLLHPLNALTSPNVKFKWTDVEQQSFYDINRTVTHDTLLVYTDLNQCFATHTYASDY